MSSVKVFLDNNIVHYLYEILSNKDNSVPCEERNAIKKIWNDDRLVIVRTSALDIEIANGYKQLNTEIKEKIETKLFILKDCEKVPSTAISYGEGVYGEGRYGMPPNYQEVLKLFKKPDSGNVRRDVQHIINCHDNKIKYLITSDKELIEAGKNELVEKMGVAVLKPSDFVKHKI